MLVIDRNTAAMDVIEERETVMFIVTLNSGDNCWFEILTGRGKGLNGQSRRI